MKDKQVPTPYDSQWWGGRVRKPSLSVAPGGKDGPRHAAATHPDSSRITKKLGRVAKMKLCK